MAGLRSPELTSDSQRASSGISPWWWALLALVVAGAVTAWLWLRRRAGEGEVSEPVTGAPDPPTEEDAAVAPDDGDDGWPAFPVLDDEPTISR